MSVVTVQLGQAGNQLGQELLSTLHSSVSGEASGAPPWVRSAVLDAYFREAPGGMEAAPVARAVLLDMEAKVVARCLRTGSGGAWRYDARGAFSKQSGSANNWACGYMRHGPATRDAIIDRVRFEVEQCDYFGGFFLTQSAAGGTGCVCPRCLRRAPCLSGAPSRSPCSPPRAARLPAPPRPAPPRPAAPGLAPT